MQRRTSDRALVERLRRICLALPEVRERVPSHGEPTWVAGRGRVFAILDDRYRGASHLAVWLAVPLDLQESLLDADPARFFRPPHVGGSGWVGLILDAAVDWTLVGQLVREAFVHRAPRKLVARLSPDEGRATRRDGGVA